MSSLLELQGLRRSYGAVVALDDLSFEVPAGQVVGFLGPNGAGKTTTMRAIFGLTDLDAGSVRWNGAPVGQAERRRFGYMPEERGLYPGMLVGQQVEYLGRLHGLSAGDAAKATATWLERLEIADRRDSKVEVLSHGNQQRVQLAAALGHNPDLLVLDEPLSGLDPTGIDAIGQVLVDQARNGCCVLFSSHQLDLVEDLCDSVTIIDHGRLVVSGTVDELATSGARRLQVRVEGDRTGDWARGLAGVTVSELVGGAVRLLLDGRRGQRRRPPGRHEGRPRNGIHLRPPAALGGIPGGAGMKTALIVVAIAALVVVRFAIWRARRRRRADRKAATAAARCVRTPPQLAARAQRSRWNAVESALGDVGLVAGREIRERLRGRIFRVGTIIMLLAVGAAVVIPTLHKKAAAGQRSRRSASSGRSHPSHGNSSWRAAQSNKDKVQFVPEASVVVAKSQLKSGASYFSIIDSSEVLLYQPATASSSPADPGLVDLVAEYLGVVIAYHQAHLTPAQAATVTNSHSVPIRTLVASSKSAPPRRPRSSGSCCSSSCSRSTAPGSS